MIFILTGASTKQGFIILTRFFAVKGYNTLKSHYHNYFLYLIIIIAGYCVVPSYAQSSATPSDVNYILQVAKFETLFLRKSHHINSSWPVVSRNDERFPRHVLQKCFEVLQKINRIRKNRGLGEITIPVYPTREITPNEVYTAAERIVGELQILNNHYEEKHYSDYPVSRRSNIRVEENYALLHEISLALDPVLGIRGFTPRDVYAQSMRVLKNAQFIHDSQLSIQYIEKPPLETGKHSNHAMKAAINLLGKISVAEKNLWMKPTPVPLLPNRKIEPNEVYDILQIVLAEQQRIKYRLGLERHFAIPEVTGTRTPNDVIQNLVWAEQLTPDFKVSDPLIQYDQRSLKKTPSDVYQVAYEINQQLLLYKKQRGIRIKPKEVIRVNNRLPKHVFQKTLHCIEKINRHREQIGLGRSAVQEHPLREITPTEVYDLSVRLLSEIKLIARHTGITGQNNIPLPPMFTSKTPTDVYEMMSRNANLLDTIIGESVYSPNDVYEQALLIIAEIKLLRDHLGWTSNVSEPKIVYGKAPRDVMGVAHEILRIIGKIQKRAGMQNIASAPDFTGEKITPNEVFNEVGIILAELISLKVKFNLLKHIDIHYKATGKSPSHVFQKMEYARRLLTSILK